jgi:hypothetical protein
MALQQIIYTSAAVDEFREVDLAGLLLEARTKNTREGLTGMLLFHEGSFLQVLEGEAANVDRVYERIGRDRRHARVTLLLRHNIEVRQFDDWAMGFVAVKHIADRLPGYSDYLRHRGNTSKAGSLAANVLREFRDGHYRNYVVR